MTTTRSDEVKKNASSTDGAPILIFITKINDYIRDNKKTSSPSLNLCIELIHHYNTVLLPSEQPKLNAGDQKSEVAAQQTNSSYGENPIGKGKNNSLVKLFTWLNSKVKKENIKLDGNLAEILNNFIADFPQHCILLIDIFEQLPHWVDDLKVDGRYSKLFLELPEAEKFKHFAVLPRTIQQHILKSACDNIAEFKKKTSCISAEAAEILWQQSSIKRAAEIYKTFLVNSMNNMRKSIINQSSSPASSSKLFSNPLGTGVTRRAPPDSLLSIIQTKLDTWNILRPHLTPEQKNELANLLYEFLKINLVNKKIEFRNANEENLFVSSIKTACTMLADVVDKTFLSNLLDIINKAINTGEPINLLLSYFLFEVIKTNLNKHPDLLKKYEQFFNAPTNVDSHFRQIIEILSLKTKIAHVETQIMAFNIFVSFFQNIPKELLGKHLDNFVKILTTSDLAELGDNLLQRALACDASAKILPHLEKYPDHWRKLVDSLLLNIKIESICCPKAVCAALAVAYPKFNDYLFPDPLESKVSSSQNKSSSNFWDYFIPCNFGKPMLEAVRAAQYETLGALYRTLPPTNSFTASSSTVELSITADEKPSLVNRLKTNPKKAVFDELLAAVNDIDMDINCRKAACSSLEKIFSDLEDSQKKEIISAMKIRMGEKAEKPDYCVVLRNTAARICASHQDKTECTKIFCSMTPLDSMSHMQIGPICETLYTLLPHIEADEKLLTPLASSVIALLTSPNLSVNKDPVYLAACQLLGGLFPYLSNDDNDVDVMKALSTEISNKANGRCLMAACDAFAVIVDSHKPSERNSFIKNIVELFNKNPRVEVFLCLAKIMAQSNPTLHLHKDLYKGIQEELTEIFPSTVVNVVTGYLRPSSR